MKLQVFDICREGTHVLGPGNRYVVWVHGCSKNCPGCISPESRYSAYASEIDSNDLAADIILAGNIDGITISGGEPFLQAEALSDMLEKIRIHRPELTVIIYTGYMAEELVNIFEAQRLLRLADVIIDGPYVESLNDNRGIRGSSNQRVISLSGRLDDYIDIMTEAPRKTQPVFNSDGTVSSIGVPHKKD